MTTTTTKTPSIITTNINKNDHQKTINNICSFETSIDNNTTTTAKGLYNYYRRAIASKDLKPGDIVNIEKPYRFQILKEYSTEYCSYCLSKFGCGGSGVNNVINKGKRCLGGCQHTYYCNRQCQIADFQIHKYTCKKYDTIIYEALSKMTMMMENNNNSSMYFNYEDFMLARNVYIKLCLLESSSSSSVVVCNNNNNNNNEEKRRVVVNFNDIPKQLPSDLDSLVPSSLSSSSSSSEVDSNQQKNPYDDDDERLLAISIAKSFNILIPQTSSSTSSSSESVEIINFFHRLLQKFRYNNFGIQNSLQTVIGSGIFPKGAILNHSCNPNCILMYDDYGTQIIRVVKPISKGSELFHSYTDLCQPTIIRQQKLQQIHGFICGCERCQPTANNNNNNNMIWINLEKELIKGNTNLTKNESNHISNLQFQAQQLSIMDDNDDYDDKVDSSIGQLQKEYMILQQILKIQYTKLGKYNLEIYKTECQALNVAMILDSNNFDDGGDDDDHDDGVVEKVNVNVLKHAEATVNFLKYVFLSTNDDDNDKIQGYGYHPLLLLQQMTLSELYDKKGQKHLATKMYQELIDKSSIIFGPNHDFVHHYKSLLLSS